MTTDGATLIAEFDCTREYPAEQYFGHEDVRVVEGGPGRYREAGAVPASRFGYRFAVRNVGRPHLAVVRYPDDKRRYMCVMDGTCYDLTTGVFTGFAQPVSGEMQEVRQVFWPRWEDCSLVLMTWGHGEPAAAAGIEVWELADLPALEVSGDQGGIRRREFGIQYEDPCGTGASQGAFTPEEWLDRVVTYARHTGQKRVVYPVAWYHGPRFPSEREPADDFRVVVAPDRRQYSWWTTRPHDWVEDLLERFDGEGLEFQASMTLLRLGSLMEGMNTDLAAIQAGADTYNNMLWNDQVQAGTQDWTPVYNARNYPGMLAGGDDCVSFQNVPLAYGEKTGQPYPPAPMFNPLHPTVQDALIGFVGEVARRYADHPSFKGVSINLWHATFLWFGTLRSGYDDYTVRLFEAETGIAVPVDAGAPDRFSQRHQFLTRVCRPAWIAWRCRKVRELVRKLRDAVVGAREDLELTLTLWNEMTLPALLGPIGASHQLHARGSNAEVYREGGLDLDLLVDEPGLCVDLQLEPARDRGLWGAGGDQTPLEMATMYRDFDFLDAPTLEAMRGQTRPGVFIFNSWVEAWGEHRWFACDADDPMAPRIAAAYHSEIGPEGGVFRMNSEYPPDGFWWDSQLRITPAFPGGVHFLEHYAHAVAELDACRITRGGLFMDTAHTEQIRRFARAFRALPAVRFETVGDSTDPVAARTALADGRRYLYLVNREYYPVAVSLRLSAPDARATDLATGEPLPAGELIALTLAPYELRSLGLEAEVEVTGFEAAAPADIETALRAEAGEALEAMQTALTGGCEVPGVAALLGDMQAAMAQGRLAWLRRALSCFIVRRIGSAAGDLTPPTPGVLPEPGSE
jgi:hypothetical protein